jgi:hypothetical protein
MIDLYYWPTPNGWKISIMLEAIGPLNGRRSRRSQSLERGDVEG